MKNIILFCLSFVLLITFSNCSKKEAVPEKCTPPSPPHSTNNSPLEVGDILKFTTASIPGATYLWTGPHGFTSNLQNPSFIYTTSTKGEYQVTASVGGCTSEPYHSYVTDNNITAWNNVVMTPNPIPNTITLNLYASDFTHFGSTFRASYEWSGPNGFTSNLQNPTINNASIDAAGTYSVTATALDANNKKSNVATTNVQIIPLPITVSSNSPITAPIAVGTTLNFTAPNIIGATSYVWAGPNGFTSTLQNPSITNVSKAAAGTYYFYYTLTSNNIKSQTSSIKVGIKYSNSGCNGQTTVTYKGETYNAVEIGNQCWLKENLKNNDGTLDSLTWGEMNVAASVSNQGACPTGWHLPDDDMWKELAIFVNGDGNQLKKIGQGTGTGAGTNTSNFSAILELNLPSNKTSSIFWSTTTMSTAPRYMQIFSDNNLIYYTTGNAARKYSVRCIKD